MGLARDGVWTFKMVGGVDPKNRWKDATPTTTTATVLDYIVAPFYTVTEFCKISRSSDSCKKNWHAA